MAGTRKYHGIMAFRGRSKTTFVKEYVFLAERIRFRGTADSSGTHLYGIKIGEILALSDAFKLCSAGEIVSGGS